MRLAARLFALVTVLLGLLPAASHATLLAYGSYLGGSGTENGYGIAVTPAGEVWVVGDTDSADFPVPNGILATKGVGREGFVSRFNAANQRVYGTYIGGSMSGDESAYGVATDSLGRAYVVGTFTVAGNVNAFLIRLAADGRTVEYSRVFGGSGIDYATAVAVDVANNAYVVGVTRSADFPTISAIAPYGGGDEIFMARFDSNGTMDYATYLGGSTADQEPAAVAWDPAGFVAITGRNARFDANGDAFLIRLNFNSLFPETGEYSVRIFGGAADEGTAITYAGGYFFLAGRTASSDLPVTTGPAYPGGQTCFVGKYIASSGALAALAYLDLNSGAGDDCRGIAYDGNALRVAGGGAGYAAVAHVDDFSLTMSFVDRLQPLAAAHGSDLATAVALRGGDVLLAGSTTSSGFPVTANAAQAGRGGPADAFLADLKPGNINLGVGDCTVTEADASPGPSCSFPITLSAASIAPVSFGWSTANGSAVAGQDYIASSGAAGAQSIAPGATSSTITVATLGDTLDEVDETFGLTLSNVVGQLAAIDATGTGTILDNDAQPTLSVSGCSVTETNAPGVVCNFVFSLSRASGQPVTFATNTANGGATGGSDFSADPGTLRTIPAGQTSLTVAIAISGDALDEAVEQFSLIASGIDHADPQNGSLVAIGTITDDDPAPVLSVANGGCSVTEGNSGDSGCTFVFNLSAASGQQVRFDLATADGTASSGSGDYASVFASSIILSAGQTSASRTVLVHGDAIHETNENFTLIASNVQNATPGTLTGTGTILNDDAAPVLSVYGGGCSNDENFGCSVIIERSAYTEVPISFTVATANGTAAAGADYTAIAPTVVTIPVGQPSAVINTTILDDASDEPDEVFYVNLSNVQGATPGSLQAPVTIIDNDQPPALSLDNNGCSVTETAGGSNCAFVFRLSQPSGYAVSFVSSTVDGSATAGQDYTGHGSTSRSFAPGTTTLTVNVPVLDDSLDEGTETFALTLNTFSHAAPTVTTATGTIADNDPAPTLSVDGGGCTVTEVDSGSTPCNLVFRLTAASSFPVSFRVSTADGTAVAGADYTALVNSLVQIPAGQTTATVPVAVLGDSIDEPAESFSAAISAVSNAMAGALSIIGTITDNDPTPVLSVDNGGCSVAEGDAGAATCDFVLRLSRPSAAAITFSTSTSAGSAATGSDFTGHAATARSIAAGATALTVSVPILGDTLDEVDETFSLAISGVGNATPTSLTATGTIVDDDATPSLSVDNGGCSVTEGDSGSTSCVFVYRLSAASGRTVTFNTVTVAQTATAGADFVAQPSTARTINPGITSLQVPVGVLADTVDEANETFRLDSSSLVGAGVGSLSAIGTIVDDDAASPGSVRMLVATQDVDENADAATIEVMRVGGVAGVASVDVATQAGSATAGVDYGSVATTVSWTDGEGGSKFVAVSIVNDAVPEPVESFQVVLGNPQGVPIGSPAATVVRIVDPQVELFCDGLEGGLSCM